MFHEDIFNTDICNFCGSIRFFPVRHHSPAAARLLRYWIQDLRPAVVLIEGPSDFNDRLEELQLPHQLPIAIYSYLQYDNGSRRGAFYPFCIYSPEWQALRTAFDCQIPVEFIDRPWSEMALQPFASHRYGDGYLAQNEYVSWVCQQVGVEDFDELWDALFEIDLNLSLQTYLERCHRLCFQMRTSRLTAHQDSLESDRFREAFMAENIKKWQDRLRQTNNPNPILVVTGGFHSYALFCRLQNIPFEAHKTESEWQEKPNNSPLPTQPNILQEGIALTPYTYDRLDSLTGYESGMANPGFYHQIWNDRGEIAPILHPLDLQKLDLQKLENSDAIFQPHHTPLIPQKPHSYQVLLAEIIDNLRQQKQQAISAADLIAVETMAKALANLRGHGEVWRQDLIDGILGALVKEEFHTNGSHPLLDAVYQVFRGNDRGRLAPGIRVPPLVEDIQNRLKELNLDPQSSPRIVDLELHQKLDLEKSQLLHQLKGLKITGYKRVGGTDFVDREDLSTLWEQWEIIWSPEFEANCIESAIYGSSLIEAVSNRLLESTQGLDRAADHAALLLLEACLMGLPDLTLSLEERCRSLIRQDSHFLRVSQALGHLLYLYRYDTILGHIRSETIGSLLQETVDRALWLLETIGTIGSEENSHLQGLKILLEVFERCPALFKNDRLELEQIFHRVSQDNQQHPCLRGGAIGALWRLGATGSAEIIGILNRFAQPEELGDFLAGLFSLSREVIQRDAALIQQIDTFIMGYSQQKFLEALPALRLAFSSFSPREKNTIALGLFPLDPAKPQNLPLEINPPIATAAFRLEMQIETLLKYYGL